MSAYRFQVEASLALYRGERDSERTSRQTKDSIKSVRTCASRLRKELEKLLKDPVFFSAGQPPWHSRPRLSVDDFQPLLNQLEKLQLRMNEAQERTRMRPGRKSTGAIDRLVQSLNWLQARVTGDNTIRSGKASDVSRSAEFIHLCCGTVGLTKGQIDRALSRNVSEYHETLTD
jgi:hypothetical protein